MDMDSQTLRGRGEQLVSSEAADLLGKVLHMVLAWSACRA